MPDPAPTPDASPPPSSQRPTPEQPRRKRPVWPWGVLGGALLLGTLVAYSPALIGGQVLSRIGEDLGVRADGVGGPLWSPSLRGAVVKQPGLSVTAGRANINVASVNPVTRTIRLNVSVNDARVNLKLAELLGGGQGGGGAAGGWKVLLNRVDVRNTQVSVDGQGINIPNGNFTVQPGRNGALAVRGRTEEGELNADVQVRQSAAQTQEYVVDLDADARVLNHYWPGVTAGRMTGRYVLGDGPVQGKLNLRGGALRVPDAGFVTVTDISGHATHEGDHVSLTLDGQGWNGPVHAQGGAYLKAGQENWTVTADASPTLKGLAEALGTTASGPGAGGQGAMKLRVTAGGWSTVRVKGYVKAPEGNFSGVPFRAAQAEYTFLNRDGESAPQTNDLAFSAQTELAGTQKLSGRWALGREGRVSWAGDFAGKPLAARGAIDEKNLVALSGQALGGPMTGTFALDGARVNAVLNPDYGGVRARVAVRGQPDDLRATVTGGVAGPYPLAGEAHLTAQGLRADLGPLKLNLDRNFKGVWEARSLSGAGVTLDGSGALDLPGGLLSGRLAAQVPGVEERLSGPLSINFARQTGVYSPGAQRLTWNGQTFGLNARNLRVAGGVNVSGALNVSTDLKATGQLTAQGNGYDVHATALGQQVALKGTLAGKPLDARAVLGSGNVLAVTGEALGGPLSGRYDLQAGTLRAELNPEFGGTSARVNLAGTPDDLNAVISGGQVGPFALSGQARLTGTGLTAELSSGESGRLNLNLNPQFRGSWQAQNLSGAGVTLGGSGRLDLAGGALSGTLKAAVPGLDEPLSGPLSVNFARQTGVYSPGAQRLTWNGQTFGLNARNLKVAGGVNVSGALTVTTDLNVTGQLTAEARGVRVLARGLGQTATLRGTVGGVTVLADANLRAPFRTAARVQGANIGGVLNLTDGGGVAFTLNTAGSVARGTVDGEHWNATGRVNLAALRPLLEPLSDVRGLAGTLDLNLKGLGGSARLNATGKVSGQAGRVQGVLTRAGGAANADLNLTVAGASAHLAGRVYPDVNMRGAVQAQGEGQPQTLGAALSGDYGALNARLTGRTTALTLGGASFPAQALDLSGTLTPKLSARGRWGDLNLGYDAATGRLNVAGAQALTVAGQAARLTGRASWAPGFVGEVDARVGVSADGEQYTADLRGPWKALSLTARSTNGLRASGTASLPEARYDLAVRGPLPGGLSVDGRVTGTGAEPRGTLNVYDGAGGSARVALRGLSDFEVKAADLSLGGQRLAGTLSARGGTLNGTLRAGPLTVVARNGGLTATGELAGHRVQAVGRVRLPSGNAALDVSGLKVNVSGPYLSAQASGTLDRLSGSLRLHEQRLGAAPAQLTLPAQVFPLRASVTAARVQVGGLTYQGGAWAGTQNARYALNGQAGVVRLAGAGDVLAALPSGPLGGRVQVLPRLGGAVTASLSPVLANLPASVRREVVPGQLVAALSTSGVTLTNTGTLYQRQPLRLNARVAWGERLSMQGVLTHPGSRVPLLYDGRSLTVRGAALDARTLRPFLSGDLAGMQGALNLDLSVPDLNPERASGRARVKLSAAGGRAAGTLSLSRGQLSADLTSTLSDMAVRVAGPLYPQANAAIVVEDVRGTLTGNARQTLTLRAAGSYAGKALNLTAQASGLTNNAGRVSVSGTVAGATLDLSAAQGAGSGLGAWRTQGQLLVPDLQPLAGVAGTVSASLGGSLADLRLNASGNAAGARFTAPASFRGGVLRVDNLTAQLDAGQVRASGTLFPALKLDAKATLLQGLPGRYTAQVGGTFSKLRADVQGVLASTGTGLQAGGSRVTGRLLGQDWKLNFAGVPLSGTARGQLGQNALAGLLDAQLRLNTTFVSGTDSVRLDGPLGWNARRGWSGKVHAVGGVAGSPLDAYLDGVAGTLNVVARVGEGARHSGVTGRLPASLPFRPGGTLNLQAFDVGALWQRAGQVRLTGNVALGGSWNRPEATFAGAVQDTQNELSGDLGLSYRAGELSARLAGPNVTGGGVLALENGRYDLTLNSGPVTLARLLPDGLDVQRLNFAGSLEARGTLARGPERVVARKLALRGEQTQAGPFSLYGSATYTPDTLDAALSGSLRGGTFRAQGALPAGVRVTVQDVNTEYPGAASLGKGSASADLLLRGALADPTVEGTVTARTDTLDAQATLSGRLRDPRLNARVALKGEASGTVYVQASGLDAARGTVDARVYGSARQGGNAATFDLQGQWPNLRGEVQARLDGVQEPVTLTGNGRGGYHLFGGTLGGGDLELTATRGFVPEVRGKLSLTPLPLLGGSGALEVGASLSGPLSAPKLIGTVQSRNAALGGVTLTDVQGVFGGPLNDLSGTLRQGERTVATFQGDTLSLTDLRGAGAGSKLSATGTARLDGTADLNLSASGTLGASVQARYANRTLAAQGRVQGPQGFVAALDVRGSEEAGWSGVARVTGGPEGGLTSPAVLNLSGDFAHPLLSGQAGVLGAGARVVASETGVNVRLVDGPAANASGALDLRPDATGAWKWGGAVSLSRPELSLSLTPSGPLDDPNVTLSLRRGEWRASGSASLKAANLSVTDGEKQGTVVWNTPALTADLPGLNLARLGIAGVGGTLTASGSVSTETQDGHVDLRVTDLITPAEVPYLGVALRGTLTGNVTLRGGKPSLNATAALSTGTLNLSAAQGAGGQWTGRVTGSVQAPTSALGQPPTGTPGRLDVDVTADTGGLNGTLSARRYPLDLMGQTLQLDGAVRLLGQTFAADLTALNTVQSRAAGTVRLEASGGLADVLPGLAGTLPLRPTEEGYALNATLDDLEVADLNIAPGLSGPVSGSATLRDGGGTFTLQAPTLNIGPKVLPARLTGTQVGGDWRIGGFLGQSSFTGGLSGGEVFGQGDLRALPLGAVVAAVAGTSPGEGVVTGVARFRFPLADPLAGSATVVAERIRVSTSPLEGTATQGAATTGRSPAAPSTAAPTTPAETLTGTGTLDFANRELRNIDVQLSGAGTWDVRGGYTREKVDLSAQFTGTTFTPVLRLIPGLAPLDPELKGTLTVSAAGTYDRPRGVLRAQNLSGSVAGLSLNIPSFSGDLPDSGAFTGGGRVRTGGTVGSDGEVTLAGQLTLGDLSKTVVKFSGLLAPQALGALPNSTVTLSQTPQNAWRVDAQSRSTNPVTGAGTLTLAGTVAPRWNLDLTARNYNLPLAVIYGRESALNADVHAEDDGELIHVRGAAEFARLTLGRVNAPDVLPAPGQSRTDTSGRTTDSYASPLPPELTEFPKPAAPEGEAPARPALPLLERLVFEDIPIRAPNGIRVDENLARAEFSGNLLLSGTGARPLVRGDITAQRGTLFLRENEFTITQGDVKFTGDGLYPRFDITANGTVPYTDPARNTTQRVPITLKVSGDFVARTGGQTVLDLTTTLTCTAESSSCTDPATGAPYTEAELYALVATGVPNLTALPGNLGALGSSALQTALNVFVLGELERSIARAFGLDVFRFTPQLSGLDGSLGATFTVGSYVTRELYLQYQVDLTGKGLIDATYSTPDNRFTFRVSTPLTGLDLQSIRPSFSAGYNLNNRTSVSLGVETNDQSTKLKFGVNYRF